MSDILPRLSLKPALAMLSRRSDASTVRRVSTRGSGTLRSVSGTWRVFTLTLRTCWQNARLSKPFRWLTGPYSYGLDSMREVHGVVLSELKQRGIQSLNAEFLSPWSLALTRMRHELIYRQIL